LPLYLRALAVEILPALADVIGHQDSAPLSPAADGEEPDSRGLGRVDLLDALSASRSIAGVPVLRSTLRHPFLWRNGLAARRDGGSPSGDGLRRAESLDVVYDVAAQRGVVN
jgi:hypothetical protein